MYVKKIAKFIEEFYKLMDKNSEEGFNLFKIEWPKFNDDERNILRDTIKGIAVNKMETSFTMQLEEVLYWLAILRYSEKKVTNGKILEDDSFPALTLRPDIKGNQIVKIFYDWKTDCIIESNFDLIAEAISLIFPIQLSTAYNTLTQKSRRDTIKPLTY